ncbi:MAG: S9 family peptidase [Phycisphaeraceae bacterium]|nr:S9 family peptidase [Phycisphaeraceae bacterium]
MCRNTSSVRLLFSLIILTSVAAIADVSKRPLDHLDYDRWNTISQQRLSHNGKWVMYTVNSGKADGDSTLVIRKNDAATQYSIVRGRAAQFTADSRFVIYQIAPNPRVVEKLKEDKAKPKDIPGTQLELLDLATGDHITVARVKSFSSPQENGDWLAYLLEKPFEQETVKAHKSDVAESYEVTPEGLRRPEKPLKLKKREPAPPEAETEENVKSKPKSKSKEKSAKKGARNGDDTSKDKKKEIGTVLVVRNLRTGVERRFPNVVTHRFSKKGEALAFVTSVESAAAEKDNPSKSKADSEAKKSPDDGVYVLDLKKQSVRQIISGTGHYKTLAFNEDGKELAFITDRGDYDAKTAGWSLYHWKRGAKAAKLVAAEKTKGVPNGWWVSSNSSVFFSEDNRRLFFDTAPIPEAVQEERSKADQEGDVKSTDKEKKARLDIWHWQDPLLQPQQLLQAAQEKRRDYVAVYDLSAKQIVQLADKTCPSVAIDRESTSDIALGVTNMAYRKMLSWESPGFQDSVLVNLTTGERNTILKKHRASARLSPDGHFVTWFDPEQRRWYAASTGPDQTPVEISKGIKLPLQNELHDTPSLPRAYGSAGWLKQDAAFLIYDRFDIWQVDPTGAEQPVCITQGLGRKKSIRFRFVQLDREARAIDPNTDMMLSAFDEASKASGNYLLKVKASSEDQPKLRPMIMLDERIGRLSKAKDANDVLFTRSTFRQSPDLWTSTTAFKKIKRISHINPQQDEYLWGTAELVRWKATDGQNLEGLLYKPEDFDPTQKYPLMVYFYERNSDNLHQYSAPAPGRSIINFSFYVSRGYVLFVPDIPYKTGEPGPSAANAVLPGTQAIVDMGFIDKERIGMQGHSWGGYQTAYLVTQTNMFACAESGAPVSNMTSAYGGIRWGSGMSRMFQYERTQSRIGDTLWAARDKYIANSPLFAADKINTPLLILHNDEDGAVPWYQGIELFVALRRLEKPAWLLNYNGNPHWVMGQENRRDFAIRMQQFFDHYLKDAPEPEWMAFGVPAVDKGENFGLELLEPESPETDAEEKTGS